jgi:hypothetical protein
VEFIKLKIEKRIETLKHEIDLLNNKFQEKLENIKDDILRYSFIGFLFKRKL